MTIDHIALLPLYAASGAAILVLLADLIVARRAVTFGALALGGIATAVCAIVVGGSRAATFCAQASAASSGRSPKSIPASRY